MSMPITGLLSARTPHGPASWHAPSAPMWPARRVPSAAAAHDREVGDTVAAAGDAAHAVSDDVRGAATRPAAQLQVRALEGPCDSQGQQFRERRGGVCMQQRMFKVRTMHAVHMSMRASAICCVLILILKKTTWFTPHAVLHNGVLLTPQGLEP